jgi:hypothetical protein
VKDNKFSDFPMIAEFCNESKNKYVTCAHLFSTLIDICEEEYLATKDGAKLTEALGVSYYYMKEGASYII